MHKVASSNQSFLTPLANVDLVSKKIKKKESIIFVGLSKVGKSTKFSHFFNAPLIGQKKGIDIMYSLKIDQNIISPFMNGIKSTTTVPTIIQRTDEKTSQSITCIDLAGFDDKRSFKEVLCVSYSIKKVFETVQDCKFVFFIPHDFLLTAQGKLYDSILRFTSIFHFSSLSQKQKKQFLDSIVFVITRSIPQYQASDYGQQIQQLVKQIKDPEYKEIRNPVDKNTVIQFLTYFSQYEQSKIYLFTKAIPNKMAPPCQLYQKNIKLRKNFKLKAHRDEFRKNNNRSMIYLPFKKDHDQLLDKNQQSQLRIKCDQRADSFTTLVQILISFFKKITNYENIYKGQISFTQQFEKMRQYNQKYNVYPAKFKQIAYEEQTKLRNIFSKNSIEKKLDIGIRLVKTVFQLFSLFQNTPVYLQKQDPDLCFQKWMGQFKEHIIKILTIFRDSFCKNFSQQEILLEFLFIAVRGCSQLGVLFEITGQNKNQRSSNLKQTLKKALQQKELTTFENQFIDYLTKHKDGIFQKIEQDQFKLYHQFIMNYKQRSQDYEIIKKYIETNYNQFNSLYSLILTKGLIFCQKTQEKIIALFNQLQQHKIKSKKDYQTDLEEQDDEDCDQVQQLNPLTQKNNFIFKSILANLAYNIMELNRQGDPEKDVYSLKRLDQLSGKKQSQIKKIYVQEQAQIARHIFIYINDVESTIKTYQRMINTIDDKNHVQKINWIKGFAGYLLQNGRKQKAIEQYQKVIQLALLHNLIDIYNQTKEKIINLPLNYIQCEKQYILKNKHSDLNAIVTDTKLYQIISEIQDNFIYPYQEFLANEKIKRARKLSQNM